MAWRILQFGALFAIGCTLESNSDSGFVDKAFETPSIDLSLKLVDPQDVVVARNQSALLKCQADSTQGPIQYTWLHYGKKILENDTNRIIQKNGDLYIPKVYSGKTGDIEYVGEYRCLVRNKVGALLSNVAKLKIASLKEFSADPVNSTVHLYQPKILRCGIHSTPPVDIQWEFNNNLILPHQTSYVPLPNGVMLIQKSQISHSGKYRCKASNDKLNKTKYSKVAYMTVLPQLTESTVPSFLPLDISPNVTVLIGDKLTLYCPVMGWPIPIVQWLFHGDIVGNASILEIPNVQNSNGGSYICRSYNKMGSISQNFNVLVRQMPNFVVKPISKLYPAAITARLDCSATGIPEPTIKWLKDGQILKFDSRIRAHAKGIIFSHTFTNDSGMYQCVATNSVGKVWAAVQIDIINVSLTPSPPQKLRCRPYNTSTICLSWKSPANISVTAYSIHSLYKENGVEVVGPDYVRNVTSMDADRLNSDTEYTFYVRLYAPGASDPSEKVTCRTGIFGNRNLDIENKDNTSVILKWSELTTDVSCTGERFSYRVQWKSDLPWSFFSNFTKKKSFLVTGLTAGVEYNFRVVSTNKDETELGTWTPYIIPDPTNSTNLNETNTTSEVTPVPPMDIKAVVQSASTIKLRWSKVQNTKFFTVCYAVDNEKSDCEDKNLVKSFTNKIHIKKLKPNTKYEFRVRAHSLDGTPGYFSEPIYATTTADVPPPVTNLEYKVINDTSIYLQWRKPKETSSKIKKYIITYSPDNIWPVENWINITLSVKDEELVDDDDDDDTVSTILGNLDCDNNYTVLVRAVSDVGVSRAMVVLHVTTKTKIAQPEVSSTDVKYKQKVGLIVGTIIALLCIVCCIACILVRRRCVKRRTMERSRMTTSNNYYPAVAHYASQIGSVQVRLEETCNDDEQENQFLVSDRITTNIPPLHTDHLDTKGGEEFPNSHSNGSAKPYMNGHVHITENPQFYPFSCNGQGLPVKLEKLTPLRYEEDPNSNVKSSKFYDLHKLFENSKKLRTANHHQCNPHFGENEDIRSSCDDIHSSESSRNVSLNGTQMTSLNDTTLNTTDQSRRKSPILGPNG